ncbi:MAG: hypothetical protein ACYC5Q_13320 [Thermoleophilia bacterium]
MAADITAGLAGWYQLQYVQGLGALSGEDSARLIAAQVINAQGRYAPVKSQLPRYWGAVKYRIDLAIKGRAVNVSDWYGTVELKWPGESIDRNQVRGQLVQDVVRVTFVPTSNLNAKFLVLGGTADALAQLFDTAHPQAAVPEARRVALGTLLSRDLGQPGGELTNAQWSANFPEAGGRVPPSVFGQFNGKLKCELLATSDSVVAGVPVASVYVWQCNRTRGTATP